MFGMYLQYVSQVIIPPMVVVIYLAQNVNGTIIRNTKERHLVFHVLMVE